MECRARRGRRPCGSCRGDHALPGPAQLGRRKPPLLPAAPSHLSPPHPASPHAGGAEGDAPSLSPHPPAEPSPTEGFSWWCGFQKEAGGDERAPPKGALKCRRLRGSVRSKLPGAPRLHGGGLRAAHPTSLPRRVSRTRAEPALAFPPPADWQGPDGPPGSARLSSEWGWGCEEEGLGLGGWVVLARHRCRQGGQEEGGQRRGKRGSPARPGLGSDGGGGRGVGAQKPCPPRAQEGNFSRAPIVPT